MIMSSTQATSWDSSQPDNKKLKILACTHCINVDFLQLVNLYINKQYFRILHALTCLVYILQTERILCMWKDGH